MAELHDVKNRILAQVPLRQLIGEKVELSRRASITTGCCPFHDERTPSFVVYDDHYHCYGCRAHGDAITYIRHVQGVGFVEALRFLAEKYQVSAPELDRSQQQNQQLQQRSSLYRAMTAAQEIFTTDLQSPAGQHAIRYLEDRGFSRANIEAFGFGLARDDFQYLIELLGRKGFRPEDLIRCSLATTSERTQRPFAFFRNRLTIPIRDAFGRIIGYGARTLSNEPAKYINSKESELYDKSRHLFGLDRAKEAIRRKNCAVIVEGYMDALQLWQNDIPESVACLGTALTASQLALLANFCNRAILLFDGDAAGTNAMLRTVATAQSVPQLQLIVAALPQGEDPDSYVRKVGPQGLRNFLKSGQDILDFAITKKLKDSHTLGVADIIENELFPWLVQIPDPLKRRVLLQRIAKLSGISGPGIEEAWLTWNRKQKSQPQNKQQKPHQVAASTKTTPQHRQTALNARDWELFGHLYFATPSELEIEDLRQQAHSFLQLDELHTAFLDELLTCLRHERAPSKQDRGSWNVSADPRILSLIDQLERKSLAFKTNNRQDAVDRILRAYRYAERTAARAKLRAKLTHADPDQQLQILTALTNLNNEISELENSNRS